MGLSPIGLNRGITNESIKTQQNEKRADTKERVKKGEKCQEKADAHTVAYLQQQNDNKSMGMECTENIIWSEQQGKIEKNTTIRSDE